jgi:hypothetical protein
VPRGKRWTVMESTTGALLHADMPSSFHSEVGSYIACGAVLLPHTAAGCCRPHRRRMCRIRMTGLACGRPGGAGAAALHGRAGRAAALRRARRARHELAVGRADGRDRAAVRPARRLAGPRCAGAPTQLPKKREKQCRRWPFMSSAVTLRPKVGRGVPEAVLAGPSARAGNFGAQA